MELVILAVPFMLLFVFTGFRLLSFIGWVIFGISWLLKLPYYLSISDYFNSFLMVAAFALFAAIAIASYRDAENIQTYREVTAFSALASLFYFPFVLNGYLNKAIIETVTIQTAILANLLGIPMQIYDWNTLTLQGRFVEIILACTGIESMSLFAGAVLGVRADAGKKVKALLVSVPVIYVLNLFRNTFIIAIYGYSIFGDPDTSFFIAHNIVSKFGATVALIAISLAVFRVLPELADLIFRLYEALKSFWRVRIASA